MVLISGNETEKKFFQNDTKFNLSRRMNKKKNNSLPFPFQYCTFVTILYYYYKNVYAVLEFKYM